MIRERTSILILGCIGTFLLLFSNAVAEVTEASSTVVSEKSDSQKASTPQEATTILTRTSSIYQNQSVAEKDGRNTDLANRKTHNDEDGSHDSVNDNNASKDVEESNVSRNASDTIHANSTKSNDKSEGSSSSDGNRKPRYEEIAAESSGKSTSTKVISEDALRLSSTNELTVTTTKLAFNDSKQDSKKNSGNVTLQEFSNHEGISDTTISPSTEGKIVDEKLSANLTKTSASKHVEGQSSAKYEDKRNLTVNKQEITTVKSIEGDLSSMYSKSVIEDIKSDEKKDKIIKSDKEIVSKSESKKNKDIISADLKIEDQELESRDRELTTVRGIQRENSSRSKINANDLGTTASEALDLEKIDEKGHEETISLIHDTYVNYDHVYRTSSEKNPKTSSGNNSIDASELYGKNDPKEEVEVVKNVSQQSTLRIVSANDTARNDSHFNELNNQEEAVYIKKKEEPGAGNENRHEQNSSAINTTIESTDDTEERKLIGKPENQVKLPETTTQSIRLKEQTSFIDEATSSPVPQGRTIGFSKVNEFPSIEVKSTASIKIDGRVEASLVTPSLRNISSTERIDQKPYPYLKSSGELLQMTTEASSKLETEGVTEETSAYENTIGRGESEKKFVVTEPSVVIENSIQQQKLDKNNINKSTNSTTETLSSLIPVTMIPIVSAVVGPTNETFPERFNNSVSEAAKVRGSETNDNDVSGVKEAEKVSAIKGEGYDVTGNGITEVSLTSDGKEVKSYSSETTESSLRFTKMPNTSKTIPLDTDIQMEPEEAMMIRSTLVVTESTMVPLDKDVATEANKSTTSMTSAMEISTAAVATVSENFTESTTKANVTLLPPQSSSNVNRTTESPSTTLNPDESRMPTTTSVEFEFISLTEAVFSANNATGETEGRTFEEQTMPSNITTIRDLSNNSTDEAITTTKSEEFTELPMTTEDSSSTTDQISIVQRNNETAEAKDLPPVTQTASEDQSNRTEFTKYSEVTVSVIDLMSATAGADTLGASGVTEDSSEDPSKDSSFNANVTETFAPGATELAPDSGVATNATKSPSVPFATSTVETRILWSTPSFTELPDEETTENIQILLPDEITMLKIIIDGTLHEVCPRLQDLRKALADILTNGMDKLVLPKQIIIHKNPCRESSNSSPTPMDGSLTSILVYIVDEDRKFDAAMTKILPSLYKVSPNFPVRIHKFLLVPEADSGNAIAVIVVSSVAFICLLLLAGLLFIMRKRQTRFNYGERCRPVSLDAYSLDSVSAYNSVRRKGAVRASKRSYGNPTFEDSSAIPSHPLNFAGLSSFCNDVNAINEEFTGIPQVSGKIDELPPGAEVKNRYANVIPLPETRVQLQKLNNDVSTEYINASYVRGPKNATKYYIACQAPIESTVTDFWRMIWEQQCKVIIMLTDLVENGVEKCTEYIPPSEVTDCHRLYGDFQVTLKKRETKEKYAISTLHLKNLENNTFREVFHIWYLWPVSGVQSDGTGLIAVLLEARALQRGGPGPIVVHCSPGTGRTGTLIALDLGIRQYEITRTVDVPRVVYTIRRDRAGAVQTKEQYAFIYKALNLYATKLAGGVLEST
ncbi:Tyrosine-protein phosphatase non-receptor type 7 [Formica fusca]